MPLQNPIKNSFTSGEWSPLLYGRSDIPEYASATKELENFRIQPQGGIARRGGSKYINAAKNASDKKVRLIRFEFSTEQAYALEFGENYIRVYKDQARLGTVEIATTYAESELFELQFTQSANVLYIAHNNHSSAKLTRDSDDDTLWSLDDIDFSIPAFDEENSETATTMSVSALSGSGVTISSAAAVFTSGMVGHKIKLFESLASRYTQWAPAIAVIIGNYRYYGDNLYIATSSGTTDVDAPVHTVGTESDGAVDWRYVNSGFGVVKVTGFTDTSNITVDVELEIPSGYTAGYYRWSLPKWDDDKGHPGSVCFFEERLWLGGSPSFPQTLWGSKSGDYENFDTGILDDDSLAYTIASDQVNAIQWLSPGKTLLSGTTGGEFNVTATTVDEAITPTNIKIARESAVGSSKITPVRVYNSVLYVQRTARKVRDIQYKFDSNSYESSDITLFAEHITKGGINEIDYQREPNDIVYAVRDDGVLVTATYLKNQAINGWTRYTLGGSGIVESVCILPAPSGSSDDEVWVTVKRTINGSVVRYIEIIENGLLTDDVEDSKYLDSSYFYDGVATDTITGLDHLEGETVSVLANGSTHPDVVVSSGLITLNQESEKVNVGYGYTSKVITLNANDGVNPGDSAQGKIKRISKVTTRLYKSVGFNIGSSESNTDLIPFRDSSMSMNDPIPLFSGDKNVSFRSSHETEGQIVITQSLPLPLTLLAIMSRIRTEAN